MAHLAPVAAPVAAPAPRTSAARRPVRRSAHTWDHPSFVRPGTRRNPDNDYWVAAHVDNTFPMRDDSANAYFSGYQVGRERAAEYLAYARRAGIGPTVSLPNIVACMPIEAIREHRCDSAQRGVVIGFLNTLVDFAAGLLDPHDIPQFNRGESMRAFERWLREHGQENGE